MKIFIIIAAGYLIPIVTFLISFWFKRKQSVGDGPGIMVLFMFLLFAWLVVWTVGCVAWAFITGRWHL